MNEILKVTLSLSLSGALLILLLTLIQSLFKERLSKRWQYYIWLIAVAHLLFHLRRKQTIGFQQGEQTTTRDVAINITEDNVKIQLNAVVEGDSHRTLEVIDPDGEVVRTYILNQNVLYQEIRSTLSGRI